MKSSCLFLLIFGVMVDNHCWNLLFIKVLKESPWVNRMFICTLRCHLSFTYIHTPVIESFIMYLNKCKYLVFMTTQFIILKYIWGKRKIIREEKTLILFMTIKVITKLPNSEQSYKGKVKTHNYINRQNQSTSGKLWKP
jgi:hypothetical protein